jgi:hypothetical protein
MIETQDQLFANLMEQLLDDLPAEPETRVVNLAAVAIGIFRSRSLQVGQVVARSPLEARWKPSSAPWPSGFWGRLWLEEGGCC